MWKKFTSPKKKTTRKEVEMQGVATGGQSSSTPKDDDIAKASSTRTRGLMANVTLLKKRAKHSFHRSLHRAASDGDCYLFESLLMGAQKNTEKYAGNIAHQQNLLKIVVNGQDDLGRTPLHYVAMKGNAEMCEIIHRYSKVYGSDVCVLDPTVKDSQGATPLHYATNGEGHGHLELGDHVEESLENIFCDIVREEDCLGKLLRWTKETRTRRVHGEKTKLTIFDKRHFVQELRDDKNMSPLHWACKYNNVKAVIRLLADIRMCNMENFNNFEQCKNFLKQVTKSSLHVQDLFGRTPLHISIAYNANLTAHLLLALEVDTLICNNFGETPLHVAAAGGNIEFVKKLLEHNSDMLFMVDNVKQTPLHQALTSNRLDVARILLEAGSHDLAKVKDVHGNCALHKAAMIKSTDALDIIASYDMNVNERTQQEQTALHVASKLNSSSALRFIIENYQEADVNISDESMMTPLLIAAEFGSIHCFKYLFSLEKTDKLAVNHVEMSCLHLACKTGSAKIVKIILKDEIFKSLLNIQDIHGNTAMHHAAENGHHEIMEALLETNHCDVTLKNADERAIVHLSARTGRPSEFELLLQKDSAQAQIRDFKDNTPLIDAAKCRNTANVQVLLKHRAEVNATNHRGYTALGYCSMRDTVSTARILIKEGASLEASFPDQLSPLQIACVHGSVQMVKFLLNKGVDVSYRATDNAGTAIEIAIDKGHEDCVIEIIKSKKWKTALRSLNYDHKKKRVMTPIRKMFSEMPDTALMVMDRCISQAPGMEEDDENFYMTVDLEFFDDAYPSGTWESLDQMGEISLSTKVAPCYKENGHLQGYAQAYSNDSNVLFSNHPLQAMIKSGHEDLLDHPLTRALVRYKWRAFGRSIYYLILVMNFMYVFLLTAYMILQPLPNLVEVISNPATASTDKWCYKTKDAYINVTYVKQCTCCPYDGNRTTDLVLQTFVLLLAGVSILKELVQIKRAKWQYFLHVDNCVELLTFSLSIPAVLNFSDKVRATGVKEDWQWEFGAAAVISAWLMLALLVRKLPIFGIYVIMVGDIIKSFAKAFLIFTIFLVGFGVFFYMTIGSQVAFHKWYLSLLRTLVMMLGELDYTDIFFPNGQIKIYDSTVLDIGYVLFIFLMPIIVMNLLVGLAVDDIKTVMENANKQKLVKKIQLALDVEFMIPPSWRRHYTKGYYKVYRRYKKPQYYNLKEFFVPNISSMFGVLEAYKENNESGARSEKPTYVQDKMLTKLTELTDSSKGVKSSLKKIEEKLKANQQQRKEKDNEMKQLIQELREEMKKEPTQTEESQTEESTMESQTEE